MLWKKFIFLQFPISCKYHKQLLYNSYYFDKLAMMHLHEKGIVVLAVQSKTAEYDEAIGRCTSILSLNPSENNLLSIIWYG